MHTACIEAEVVVFFFQAEDGIRDVAVTGVQTCALPICTTLYLPGEQIVLNTGTGALTGTRYYPLPGGVTVVRTGASTYLFEISDQHQKIGRASCRERV